MSAILGAAIVPFMTNILSILGPACFAIYAIFRLNSTQIIREKIWSTFVGDKDFNDTKLQSFGQAQLDLTRFRLVYGVSARSVADLHRLLSWMDRHRLTPIEVKRARACIDPSKDEPLTAPRTRHLIARAALLAVIATALVLTFKASTSRTTLLTMHASKTWLWSDGASVEGVRGKPWRLDARSCASFPLPAPALTRLTDNETVAICKGFADGTLKDTVSKGLTDQRQAAIVLMVFAFPIMAIVAFSLGGALNARSLVHRVQATTGAPRDALALPTTANLIEQ
ncbi:hypothetical protein G3N96_23190 [Burkholderia sp. Se-20373]|uniref:DUF6216 family protein n=1 Tax=Burkholderia sp. Se-20373 TaxID=2703898 RepID=UPI00197F8157|nr:DUF6216 family protein [Burkholderia sp. Se-20373]MBN3748306.1 hypothetical protein [Burkholderia sp. Se-20373]